MFLRYFQTRTTATKCLCHRGWKIKSFLFPDNGFGTFAFQLASNACVSHLLRGQLNLLECYYWNCLIGTHMCIHPVSEWSVFLPFSVNCSQAAMIQIMPALCLHRQGEGVGGGQPNVDRPVEGGGGPKNSQICVDTLYGWPLRETVLKKMLHNFFRTCQIIINIHQTDAFYPIRSIIKYIYP